MIHSDIIPIVMKDTMVTQFKSFLSRTPSQKEVSLIIAKDREEITEFEKILMEQGFQETKTAIELLGKAEDATKTYLNLDDSFNKEVYDFLVQYPTGQVGLFDSEQMKQKTISPVYKNSAVVFLVLKNTLRNIENKGYGLRSVVGMAYQS